MGDSNGGWAVRAVTAVTTACAIFGAKTILSSTKALVARPLAASI